MLRLYLSALWRHWAKLLTGGSLIAATAVWTLTGNNLWPKLGMAIVGLTLVSASFHAWREERSKVDAHADQSPRILGLHAEASALYPMAFLVRVDVMNPGPQTDLLDDWTLDVSLADGVQARGLRGLVVSDSALPAGKRTEVMVNFRYREDLPNNERLRGASYSLTVTDIHGHTLTWPPHAPVTPK